MSDVKKIGSAGIPLNIVDANGRKIMGDAYDNTATYAVGDYCINGDHAYKCIIEIETPEDFNTNHWQQITIEEILKEHDASIESVNASLTNLANYLSDSNTLSVQASIYTDLASVNLTKGTWLILSYVITNTNNTGIYIQRLSVGTTNRSVRNSQNAGGGNINFLLISVSGDSTAKLDGYFPVACNATGVINAIKLG